MNRLFTFLVTVGLVLVLLTCVRRPSEPQYDNPLDPLGDAHIEPDTWITSVTPAPDSLNRIDSSTVIISWGGNKYITQYSCSLSGDDAWTAWDTATSRELIYLDEKDYTFFVKGRYSTLEPDITPAETTFVVDAVQGPALIIRPRKSTVSLDTTSDSTFFVDVYVEDVDSLLLLKILLDYNPSKMALDSDSVRIVRPFLEQHGASIIPDPFYEVDTFLNQIKIQIGLVEGHPAWVSGSGRIAQIFFKALQPGSTYLRFNDSCKWINADYDSIQFIEKVDGLIFIE